jgi:hypothetical protein
VPSLAIPLSLILAAATGSAAVPPQVGGAGAPSGPAASKPAPAATAANPAEAKGSKSLVAPAVKTTPASAPASRAQGNAAVIEEPQEEIVSDSGSNGHHRTARRTASADRPDIADRRGGPTPDRYAAVVPPGLTLTALRAQLAKVQLAPTEGAGTAPSSDGPGGTLADLEKAREALRQETARLEALLKAGGGCGGSGFSMPIGEGLAATPVSAAALREAPTEQIDTVSKAMKGMKPEQAAAVVARLDRGLAAEIMRRMKAADAGAILGLLKPELAAELATQIATRKSVYGKDLKKGAAK